MYEKGFAYLLQAEHEKVIYGVLKHLHVSRQDPDYEDLVVEGLHGQPTLAETTGSTRIACIRNDPEPVCNLFSVP